MASVSEELKRERELRGISLEQMAEETKIGIRFLQAIDAGRFELIPGEFYRRSYIRAYADYLGMDGERTVSAYQFQIERPSGQRALADTKALAERPSPSRVPRWLVFALLGVAAVAAAGVWSKGGADLRMTAAEPPAVPLSSSRGIADAAPARLPFLADELERAPDASAPLRLVLRVDDTCWLEATADGDVVAEGLMLSGFRQEIRAREEIRLWLGNAGGVSLWINEKPAKPLGIPGQVRKDVLITPDNVSEFLVP